MASRKYNVAVIGYGMSAKVFHIPLILSTPTFTLYSIVQRTPKPSDSASADHPSAKIYQSAEQMFADKNIDIIVITTTPNTHFSFTKSALEAGKHVIVEKPFVPTSKEAEQLIEVSKTTGKLICVYQNRRWDADFLTLQHLLKSGGLGRVVDFETHYDRYKPMRPETWKGTLGMADAGGIIYDLGTHLIDQVYVLYGMPKTVTGFFTNQRNDGGAEPDSVTVILRYEKGGPLVTVKAGVMSIETQQLRYWVRGTKGSFKKFGLDVQEDQLKAGKRPADDGFGVEKEEAWGSLVSLGKGDVPEKSTYKATGPGSYNSLYEGFNKAVEGGGEGAVPVKAREAMDVLRIIEGARESAKTGRTVEL